MKIIMSDFDDFKKIVVNSIGDIFTLRNNTNKEDCVEHKRYKINNVINDFALCSCEYSPGMSYNECFNITELFTNKYITFNGRKVLYDKNKRN
jgi:hypothetical protein